MKENLFLLKDLLGRWKRRFLSTAVSKNVYFNVLDDIVNKYSNTVHRTIKMKPIDVVTDSYGEYNEDSNEAKPKFKVGNHVRISKYKKVFAKGYMQKLLLLAKLNILYSSVDIRNLNGERIAGSFYEKELQKM